MIVETRDKSGISICCLKGSFESPQDLEAFAGEMERLLLADRIRIVLDLHLLAYLNSNAVGRMVKYKKRVEERGGELVLLQPTKTVREVLELLQLLALFRPYATEAEAMAAAQSGSVAAPTPAPAVPPASETPEPPAGIEVLFQFLDARTQERLGRFEATGVLEVIDLAQAHVLWRPAPVKADVAGAVVLLKLLIPRYRRATYLEIQARVSSAEPVAEADDSLRLTVDFGALSAEDRRDIELYIDDLAEAGKAPKSRE